MGSDAVVTTIRTDSSSLRLLLLPSAGVGAAAEVERGARRDGSEAVKDGNATAGGFKSSSTSGGTLSVWRSKKANRFQRDDAMVKVRV